MLSSELKKGVTEESQAYKHGEKALVHNRPNSKMMMKILLNKDANPAEDLSGVLQHRSLYGSWSQADTSQ